MNAIAFGTKRVFHGFLRLTRKWLASLGLTAARFDMMHALLAGRGEDRYFVPRVLQRDLRRALGVTAPVISRMLASLERLGFVRRQRPRRGDQRQREVTLTERGQECIRTAQCMLLKGVQRLVFETICFGKHDDPDERILQMAQLEGYLSALRRDFGDTAMLSYSWGHPDD